MNQQQTTTASFNLIVLNFTHLRQRREEKTNDVGNGVGKDPKRSSL